MSLLDNRHVASHVYDFSLDGFNENSRLDLELLIDILDDHFEAIEHTKSRELVSAKKAAIAVRDQYEALGLSRSDESLTSNNGRRIFLGVSAA